MIGAQGYVIPALRGVRQSKEPESHLICGLDKQRVDSAIGHAEKSDLSGSLFDLIGCLPEFRAIARSLFKDINQGKAIFRIILNLQTSRHGYCHSDRLSTIDSYLSKQGCRPPRQARRDENLTPDSPPMSPQLPPRTSG